MERAFKGVWIPAEIWLNEGLSVMEKVLYAEIDSFCGSGKECFCSNAHFAHLLQVSERQVQRLLVSLEKKGIISRRMVYKEGGKEVDKRYLKPVHVTTPPDKAVTTPPDEIVTPSGDENVVGTNPGITNPIDTNIERVSNDTPPSKKKPTSKRFIPPTPGEERAYVQEKNLNVDADFFCEYYSENDWHDSNGKPVKKWKLKCLTWHNQSNRQNGSKSNRADREKESAAIRAELERKMQSA
jgi:hypothetical protein